MIDVEQFRLHIVRATLMSLRMWSMAAENLLLGTAVQESGLKYLRQFDAGPARGVYQIEPATHDDIVKRYLKRKPALRKLVSALAAPEPSRIDQLATNLAYATAICRLRYWMVPKPLPEAGDIKGLAKYWKDHFHTYHTDRPEHAEREIKSFAAKYRRYITGRLSP